MILDLLIIFASGILKILSGINFPLIAVLYVLIFSRNFKLLRFTIYMLGAELFNFGFPGLYILGLGVVYLLYKYIGRIFQTFLPLEILVFVVGYILVRVIYNLPILINFGIDMSLFALRLVWGVLGALVVVLFFIGMQRCLIKFTNLLS
jgi:hypothetical protein